MTQPTPRFHRTLTFFTIVLTSVLATMAWSAWTGGEPSPASLFAPRTQVKVMAATVQEGKIDSAVQYRPLVVVEWPQGSGVSRTLGGLEPSFFSYQRAPSQAIAARYDMGEFINVRVVDGQPVADRTDLFRMAHALFLSVLAVMAGLFTYVFFRTNRADRRARR